MYGLSAAEPEKIEGSFETFKDEADNLLRNGEYKKAIDNYTSALHFRPDDRMTLVYRSRCYLMLGDSAKALKDAEATLVEDKKYHKGIFQKAEALFNQGDFEMALVFYHRGHNVRPELHNFRVGIKKAQEAIYNCVGTPDRIKLNLSGDLSFFHLQDEKKVRNKGALCTQKQQAVVKRVRPTEKPGSERTIKQMLGDLYGDRIYLEKLLLNTDNATVTGKKVRTVAQNGLAYLNRQKDFWQQVKPIYARKYEARLAVKKWKTSKISTHDYVLKELEKIDNMMTEKNFDAALKRSLKLLSLLDSYSENQLSNKMMFTAATHSAIGSAYFELKDYANAEKHHLRDLAIGEEWWERKLPMSRDGLESTWLCHELGQCYLTLGKFRIAKDYGERSLAAAKEVHDDRWQLHALVLISQAEAKAKRLSSSLGNFEKALEIASLLRDTDAEKAIQKAIDGVNKKILDRENERLVIQQKLLAQSKKDIYVSVEDHSVSSCDGCWVPTPV